MNINIKDIVTLSDDIKYMVISKSTYENKIYYLFMDINNSMNVKVLEEKDNKLIEINDKGLIKKILPSLYNEVKKEIHL